MAPLPIDSSGFVPLRHPCLRWGEAVKAVVIMKKGQNGTAEEIINWCRGKVGGFKKPKSVDFISTSEMPKTTTGKILHRKLRERYAK